jgi:hypothetical protein
LKANTYLNPQLIYYIQVIYCEQHYNALKWAQYLP